MIAIRRIWIWLASVPVYVWALAAAVAGGWWLRSQIARTRSAKAALKAERRSAEEAEQVALYITRAETVAAARRARAAAAERAEIARTRREAARITEAAASGHAALAAEMNRAMADTDTDPEIAIVDVEEDTQP